MLSDATSLVCALAIKAQLNTGTGSTVHLFVNDIHPDPDTVVGDFTEPTWTGYDATPLHDDWGELLDSDTNNWCLVPGTSASFHTNDPVSPPDTVYGYYVLDGAGDLVNSHRFTTPWTVADPGDTVVFVPYASVAIDGDPDGLLHQ